MPRTIYYPVPQDVVPTKTVTVELGGTGATTPEQALQNLGGQPSLDSGVNIKSIFGQTLLGAGDIVLVASDVPELDWSKITTGKPTTLSGYGISDALTLGNTPGSAAGTAAAGTATTAARSDHVHPLQTSVSGNAGTATKLETARTINGVSFDGTADITVNAVDSTARIASSEKGAANGVATLDGAGKVPAAQLPSYVDDVVEYADLGSFPGTGETGKIYVDLDTGKIYRWSGSAYIEISPSPGSTDSVTEGAVNLYFTAARAQAAVTSVSGNAGTATKLQTARTLSATGDATGSASFDGSADAAISLTLANSGATAGTYKSVTVDAKGRVTAGANPTTLSGYGITDAVSSSTYTTGLAAKQDTLVSGTNIKTVNGTSVLGSGNIAIQAFATGDITTTASALSEPSWIQCKGQAVSQTTYASLFALLGIIKWGQYTTKLANVSQSPATSAIGVAYSDDSTYMAVTSNEAPYVTIYKRTGDTYTKLAAPASLPPGASMAARFSPNGTYLAVTSNVTPFITIYSRSGDTFTKLSNPATLPPDAARDCAWSPDSAYLAVTTNSAPYVTIYKQSAGVFTKLANPASLPPGAGQGLGFSPNGTYLSVTSSVAPYLITYSRSGDTFTKITDPTTAPAGDAQECAWSTDNSYLAVAHVGYPYLTVYKQNAGTLTKLANPDTVPVGDGQSVMYSGDGKYLVVTHTDQPFFTVYKLDDDVMVKMQNATEGLPATAIDCGMTLDGNYLAVTHYTAPYITIYKATSYDQTTQFAVPSITQAASNNLKTYIKA